VGFSFVVFCLKWAFSFVSYSCFCLASSGLFLFVRWGRPLFTSFLRTESFDIDLPFAWTIRLDHSPGPFDKSCFGFSCLFTFVGVGFILSSPSVLGFSAMFDVLGGAFGMILWWENRCLDHSYGLHPSSGASELWVKLACGTTKNMKNPSAKTDDTCFSSDGKHLSKARGGTRRCAGVKKFLLQKGFLDLILIDFPITISIFSP
jgi:hypothetical protein